MTDLTAEIEKAMRKHVRDGTVRGHILLDDAILVCEKMVQDARLDQACITDIKVVEAVRKEMHTHGPWSALIRIHTIATGGAWDPEQYTDFRASDAIAAVEGLRAEQPAAVATPKRPCTHMVDPREKYCADCWGKPSLLREAEVRLEAIESVSKFSCTKNIRILNEARAEVERLKNG